MKIGIAVQVLPLCHPLRLAEEAATVDQISKGRLIFGVGRSGVVSTYDAYQVPYDESRERFAEILDIVKEAWSKPRFSYEGKYYSFDDVACVPHPYSNKLPPIRIAASTPDTFPAIGGARLSGLRQHPACRPGPRSEPQVASYQRGLEGRPGARAGARSIVAGPIYIAETDEQARDEARESVEHFYRLQYELIAESARRSGRQNFIDRAEHLRTLTYDDALRGNVIVGSPDTRRGPAQAVAGRDRLRRHPRRAELRRHHPARPGDERAAPAVPGGQAAVPVIR